MIKALPILLLPLLQLVLCENFYLNRPIELIPSSNVERHLSYSTALKNFAFVPKESDKNSESKSDLIIQKGKNHTFLISVNSKKVCVDLKRRSLRECKKHEPQAHWMVKEQRNEPTMLEYLEDESSSKLCLAIEPHEAESNLALKNCNENDPKQVFDFKIKPGGREQEPKAEEDDKDEIKEGKDECDDKDKKHLKCRVVEEECQTEVKRIPIRMASVQTKLNECLPGLLACRNPEPTLNDITVSFSPFKDLPTDVLELTAINHLVLPEKRPLLNTSEIQIINTLADKLKQKACEVYKKPLQNEEELSKKPLDRESGSGKFFDKMLKLLGKVDLIC